MLVLSFFNWWYGRGWAALISSLGRRTRRTASDFSVAQLLRTFFSPWRRIITYPGASLSAKWHAWLDNLFSRVIGSVVRLVVLAAALLVIALVGLITLVQIIIWPLLPIAIPGFIIAGLAL